MTEEQRLEIYRQGGEYEDDRENGSLPAIITPDTVTSLFKDTPKDRRVIEWRGSMRSVFNGRWNSWSRVSGLHGLAMMCGLTEIAFEVFDFLEKRKRFGNYTAGCWIPKHGNVYSLAALLIKGNRLDLFHFLQAERYNEGNAKQLWSSMSNSAYLLELMTNCDKESRDDP